MNSHVFRGMRPPIKGSLVLRCLIQSTWIYKNIELEKSLQEISHREMTYYFSDNFSISPKSLMILISGKHIEMGHY